MVDAEHIYNLFFLTRSIFGKQWGTKLGSFLWTKAGLLWAYPVCEGCLLDKQLVTVGSRLGQQVSQGPVLLLHWSLCFGHAGHCQQGNERTRLVMEWKQNKNAKCNGILAVWIQVFTWKRNSEKMSAHRLNINCHCVIGFTSNDSIFLFDPTYLQLNFNFFSNAECLMKAWLRKHVSF